MSTPRIPDSHVNKSLEHAVAFSEALIIPFLTQAVAHTKSQVEHLPKGARRHLASEKQAAPRFITMRMHQLFEGYNLKSIKEYEGNNTIQCPGASIGAMCLVQNGIETRLLKEPATSRPLKRRGRLQAALINQDKYQAWAEAEADGLGLVTTPPILDFITKYLLEDLVLASVTVSIPYLFDETGTAIILASRPLNLNDHLEIDATFTGAISTEDTELGLLVAERDDTDPYADAASATEETTGPPSFDAGILESDRKQTRE